MGDLSFVSDANLKFFLFVVPLGILVLQFFARDLDILALGEEKALHLGLQPEQLKRILFVVCSFVVAACVANCGLIGFVGLIVPHLFRFFGLNYSSLNASTGFKLTALFAGIKPARIPEKIRITKAVIPIEKLISG